ncbi:exonuclease domain-containing protein [Sporolactobacillus sp. CPB3-1]|uniref:Exonuclease domain-containing protein n=1 Tax=Sporolactobacillus mangiferae TaxID=2940498 RepID=A0ABT0M7H0_9BACL|nr:3'-5' exonuclease [Sporolactobacillus mangiferae]MCL1630789.1 exonuclease domain-containing protein [Sporolactobacillus mangiferae]
MDYLIVDFEANTSHVYANGIDEIIQFSCGIYHDHTSEDKIKFFNSYIKPNFGIQNYIRKLTGITMNDVSHAPYFSAFVSALNRQFFESVIFVSFSHDDIRFFLDNAFKYHANTNWIKGYMNLQEIIMADHQLTAQPSLRTALSLYGIDFKGKWHNANDDVLNTTRLFRHIEKNHTNLNRWIYNRQQFFEKFNILLRADKDGYIVITKQGKKILRNLVNRYPDRDVNFLMHTGIMKKTLEKNRIDNQEKKKMKALRRYIQHLYNERRYAVFSDDDHLSRHH